MIASTEKFVSIVLVTCGKKDYLWVCLKSIYQQTYSSFEVIVIDNSLNQEISASIKSNYPQVKLLSAEKNLYYCAALNWGIRQSRGSFILCLNDDIQLTSSFLEEAVKAMAVSENVGLVSGKLLRAGSDRIDSAGMRLSLWLTPVERGYGQLDTNKYQNPQYVFAINCAAAVIRKTALDAICDGDKWFDEEFKIFFEDLDVSWRARNRGWRAFYTPYAVAYHARGGSVREEKGIGQPWARLYLDFGLQVILLRNRYLVLIKNASGPLLLLHSVPMFIYECFLWTYLCLFRREVARAFWADTSLIKRIWRERKSSQRMRTIIQG